MTLIPKTTISTAIMKITCGFQTALKLKHGLRLVPSFFFTATDAGYREADEVCLPGSESLIDSTMSLCSLWMSPVTNAPSGFQRPQ